MNRPINIFCLPFAGGNKYSYREYAEKAQPLIQIIPLEYPGRGARMRERLLPDVDALVEDLYMQVRDRVDKAPYAIYGHSMGGLLAYLLTLKLLKNNHSLPIHLFITGTSGPSDTTRGAKKRFLLDKKEFIEEIKDFGGMPDEILQNDELLYYFEPILRSDFTASENYKYQPNTPLNIPITVITGSEEDMTPEEIQLWQNETTRPVDFIQLPGNHFFIVEHVQAIVDIIYKKLYSYSKVYHI